MPRQALYRGFSTYNRNKNFRLSDFDCAKQDLFNHLHTRKGERLMNPEFGCIVWNLLFEPLTPETKNIIADDLSRIVSSDPRLAIENMTIEEYDSGIRVLMEITMVDTDQTERLSMNFDKQS